jgi:hypothetical protein
MLPVAIAGMKEISCFGCGIAGHKKGDPICKAGKYDAHANAPQDYKDRMAKKRKAAGNGGGKSPSKPEKKGGGRDKKHCHAFNFEKGNCRYGAKCHFLHGKNGEKGNEKSTKLPGFTVEQNKLVTTLLSSAMKRTAAAIARKSKKAKKNEAKKEGKSADEGDDEDFSAMLASCFLAPVKNRIRRDFKPGKSVLMATNLHSVHKNCGIDSDDGISISTLRDDFAWIDESSEAKASIQSPSGINGDQSTIGGRGPMIVRARTGEYLIDPDAVFLMNGEDQPNFRVISTQRLKSHGVRLVGCFKGSEKDVLQDRLTKGIIELAEEGPEGKKILVLDTMKCPAFKNLSEIKHLVDEVRKRNRSAMVKKIENDHVNANIANEIQQCQAMGNPNTIMAFKLAKVSDEERSRLFCRRMGYCNPKLLKRMSDDKDFGELP